MKAFHGFLAALVWSGTVFAQAASIEEVLAKANAGDVASQVAAAVMYAKGSGVARNPKEAVTWFTKAAEQGNPDAQCKLGALYLGGKGLPKDSLEASKWFLMAAENGLAAAQLQMARMHLAGAGVVKDDVEAYKWAKLAMAAGDKQARPILALLKTRMTADQTAKGELLLAEFKAKAAIPAEILDSVPQTAPPLEE